MAKDKVVITIGRKRIKMPKDKVVITMGSGTISSVKKDKHIKVIVHDYDTDGVPDEETEVDKNGDRFVLSKW